jgi:glucokinase
MVGICGAQARLAQEKMPTRAILAGDIGGAKTHLGLYQIHDSRVQLRRDRVYATRDFSGLEEVLNDFISKPESISSACFGVPGPVIDGVSHAVNLPWTMEAKTLSDELGGVPIHLLNDLAATAYGVIHLAESETLLLQQGDSRGESANKGIIAAGTGLGEAGLVFTSGGYHAVASEGGAL